ncbi:hypothetical protein TREMEDRAFT_26174 [Tremella mesenterica DSM 1558]|uniref:uncharacterized protein n=1 Tax=Tremella mesenterica (strain ATCC 24925 / CBS 8224 / DSM 1558 / NBRC 9311 / NRRL Y-6157 / RJB 2259-6 / UBC 559-6) TaxID=578456 RepID=UPI0003F4981B|nr:uncharacterized protein TREMEDRAFT_26174 [Tremella mesenterica DSM 1558]EIW73358.1 hypothetical protein TREMEDRAFT_26174 [Tremella mesenterica DSM 1558]
MSLGDIVVTASPLEDDSDPTYTHFAHRDEFINLLTRLVSVDVTHSPSEVEEQAEVAIVKSLGSILDFYLPLPGLLDPSLGEILSPLLDKLSSALDLLVNESELIVNAARLHRLGQVINWLVKVRGWKAIVPHFPSDIKYINLLVSLLSPSSNRPSSSTTPPLVHHPLLCSQDAWELRAVLLLWLAMLLTVPFNLSVFSIDQWTSSSLDLVSKNILFSVPTAILARQVIVLSIPLLDRPGKEGVYAALVLARLYSREDVVNSLPGFLDFARQSIQEGDREAEANLVACLFSFLAFLPAMMRSERLEMMVEFEDWLLDYLSGTRTAASSGLIRKLAVKTKGRWWLARLSSTTYKSGEVDMPEGLEAIIDSLMSGLSDKDTIVRYSSAKYLARLAALLPPELAHQIVVATLELYNGTEDIPVILSYFGTIIDPGGSPSTKGTMGLGGYEMSRGEARWHGVCLASAELARRGLLKNDAISGAITWGLRALSFDLRRSSHSIGANVRDAAAYLLWSISRACTAEEIAPYAEKMATSMVCVACFDREVGVRRAASAAFQEGVGRLGLYPEGIDVLGHTDFFSVSVRRAAFTEAAPAVAKHEVYRRQMREHLHRITLRHWDTSMRTLAGGALRCISELGDVSDLQDSLEREINNLISVDPTSVHGALVALLGISTLDKSSQSQRLIISKALSTIRSGVFLSPVGGDILKATCELFTTCLSQEALNLPEVTKVLDLVILSSMRRREAECHEAVADVYTRLSELTDPTGLMTKLINDLKSIRPPQRQSAALSLGHIRYLTHSQLVQKAIEALLRQLDSSTKADVETRRNTIRSLTDICLQTSSSQLIVDTSTFKTIFNTVIKGLDDYSTDQRGDVGSWIRIVSLRSLGRIIPAAVVDERVLELVSQVEFDEMIGGMIKQSLERLGPVRAAAACASARVRSCAVGFWDWEGIDCLRYDEYLTKSDSFRYVNLRHWFTSSLPLLRTKYRLYVLSGLTQSIGTSLSSDNVAFESLSIYMGQHSEVVHDVMRDLSGLLMENINTNRIFLPVMGTLTRLLNIGFIPDLSVRQLVKRLVELIDSTKRVLLVGCKGLDKMKSIERITTTMRLDITSMFNQITQKIGLFLNHRFPRIRAMCAEELYLILSDSGNDVLEDLLLKTVWTEEVGDVPDKVVAMLDSLSLNRGDEIHMR